MPTSLVISDVVLKLLIVIALGTTSIITAVAGEFIPPFHKRRSRLLT